MKHYISSLNERNKNKVLAAINYIIYDSKTSSELRVKADLAATFYFILLFFLPLSNIPSMGDTESRVSEAKEATLICGLEA